MALALCVAGCDRLKSSLGSDATSGSESPGKPPAGMKICFTCNGAGKMACTAPGCKDGKADCPGPCLKLSTPGWHHMDVAGHPPTDLWQSFRDADGGGGRSWNQNHIGEVIEMQNGKPVNIGKCKVCGGTGKVRCPVCFGGGKVLCQTCEGKKFVPDSWTAFNNPRLKNPPGTIRLRDGRTIFGKIEVRMGSRLTIRTADGSTIELNASEIVPEGKAP